MAFIGRAGVATTVPAYFAAKGDVHVKGYFLVRPDVIEPDRVIGLPYTFVKFGSRRITGVSRDGRGEQLWMILPHQTILQL